MTVPFGIVQLSMTAELPSRTRATSAPSSEFVPVTETVSWKPSPFGENHCAVSAAGVRLRQTGGDGVDGDLPCRVGGCVLPGIDRADVDRVLAVRDRVAADQPVPRRGERRAGARRLEQDVGGAVLDLELPVDRFGEATAQRRDVTLPVAVGRERGTRIEDADDGRRAVAWVEVG